MVAHFLAHLVGLKASGIKMTHDKCIQSVIQVITK